MKITRRHDPPDDPKPTQFSSPLAQALVAGLLQGLGEKYGDNQLLEAGNNLARKLAGCDPRPE